MRDQHVLLWKSVKILNLFNNLTLKQILWKIKAFFKKTGVSFLVESTKIENASFPYKTAISEANGKTNSMGTTKWNTEQMDHKEQSFSSNYLIFFWIFCFSLATSYKELICCTNNPNVHICTFCKRWRFIWWCFFPVSIFSAFRYGSLVCDLFETFSFFFCNPFVLFLPFWITNLNASNLSCEIILKRK